MPDHVLYFVDVNQAHLIRDLPERNRYGFVKQAVNGARAIGLRGMMDLVNYTCMALIYGERWHSDKDIGQLVVKVKNGELGFSDAMDLSPPSR